MPIMRYTRLTLSFLLCSNSKQEKEFFLDKEFAHYARNTWMSSSMMIMINLLKMTFSTLIQTLMRMHLTFTIHPGNLSNYLLAGILSILDV